MSPHDDTAPATTVCPGCGAGVGLPPERLVRDGRPVICASCGSELPDAPAQHALGPYPRPRPTEHPVALEELPVEERRYSRGGLFKSLGGILAERGVEAVESAKDRFTT